MNSIVGPISNEKIAEKWNLCWKGGKKSNFAAIVHEQ